MKNYLLKRLLALIVTLFIIVSVAFLVIRLMPGTAYDDPSLSPQVLEAIDKKYHLDEPLIVQYGIFLKSILLDWDWGTSIKIQPTIPVFQVLESKIPLTLAINLIALAVSIPIGIIAGVLAAIKKNTLTDHVISFLVVIFISIPSFVFATVLRQQHPLWRKDPMCENRQMCLLQGKFPLRPCGRYAPVPGPRPG